MYDEKRWTDNRHTHCDGATQLVIRGNIIRRAASH